MKSVFIAPSTGRIGRVARGLACVSLITGLAACGLPQKVDEASKVDYKSANRKTSNVNLEIPPDLANPRSNDRYAIPASNTPEQKTLSGFEREQAARPQAVSTAPTVLPGAKGVKVERSGNTRWLVVDQPPDKLWPVVREFWQESGFTIDRDDPVTGIMETDWAENRAKLPQDFIRNSLGKVFDSLYDTGTRDKFRTRFETGPNGTTEIYITHRGMVEVVNSKLNDSTVWQPRPADHDLEAEFLRRLLVKLGADADKSKALIANAANDPGSGTPSPTVTAPADVSTGLKLVDDPTSPRIEIGEGFDRAWRRVGLALDRGSFTVEDRDRSQGVYYVRYIDPEIEAKNAKTPGFFGKLFSWGSKDKESAARRQYRIRVIGSGADASTVSVLSRDGQQVTADADRQAVHKILALLNDQLKQ